MALSRKAALLTLALCKPIERLITTKLRPLRSLRSLRSAMPRSLLLATTVIYAYGWG